MISKRGMVGLFYKQGRIFFGMIQTSRSCCILSYDRRLYFFCRLTRDKHENKNAQNKEYSNHNGLLFAGVTKAAGVSFCLIQFVHRQQYCSFRFLNDHLRNAITRLNDVPFL